ncbi:MAG: prolipoprotein diacylglyceryl transferase [Verrucomicrobia bacterium]|nr:MAG: prolipoprotein diacylglyceryl transferase [Verrucomicrobiota bacterium]
MHPIAFELLGRPIYWFGVMMALGFLAAIAIWNWLAPRTGRPAGYGSELGFWVMISGVVGARVVEVLTNWTHYRAQPWEILRVDHGGLVFYGGFIGACLAVIVFARLRRDPLWTLADFAVIGLPLGHVLGRIGCFLNGCCYGVPSNLPWAVCFPPDHESHGVPVHPTELYESAFNLLLFGLLLTFFLRRRPPAGRVFALYLLIYPPFRLLVECIREEPHGAFGLTVGQQTSIPLFWVGLALWWWSGRNHGSVHRPT